MAVGPCLHDPLCCDWPHVAPVCVCACMCLCVYFSRLCLLTAESVERVDWSIRSQLSRCSCDARVQRSFVQIEKTYRVPKSTIGNKGLCFAFILLFLSMLTIHIVFITFIDVFPINIYK